MGIGLTEDELWDFLAASRTGILTTLRSDGWPVSLPIWFVAFDGSIYFRTYPKMRKVARILRDPRASFVVEEGEQWTALRAASLRVTAEVLPPGAEADAARRALAVKYPPEVDVPMDRLPEASKRYYAGDDVIVKLKPVGPPITWNNGRLRLLPAQA